MARDVDEACGIAQAAAVMGDWWNLLVLREVARGRRRFDALVDELGVSRKVLTERLGHLVDHEVLARVPYQDRPPRHEYHLTDRGRAFLPVLVGMQDWADRWLLGDGRLTATAPADGAEAARMRSLPGGAVPADLTLVDTGGAPRDPVAADARATVLFTYPATGRPTPLPAGWNDIPGTVGCTLENRLFRDRWPAFAAAGVAVHGVSTQRPRSRPPSPPPSTYPVPAALRRRPAPGRRAAPPVRPHRPAAAPQARDRRRRRRPRRAARHLPDHRHPRRRRRGPDRQPRAMRPRPGWWPAGGSDAAAKSPAPMEHRAGLCVAQRPGEGGAGQDRHGHFGDRGRAGQRDR